MCYTRERVSLKIISRNKSMMPALNEIYTLEKLPGETSSVVDYEKDKKNKDISNDETNNKKSSTTKFKPFIGILCTFIHALITQTMSSIVKKVSYISIFQLSLIRYIGMFSVSLPLAILYTNHVLGEKSNRVLLLLRAIMSATALIFQIAAYRYLQLVQASIVMSTLPFVTALTARIILKETFGFVQTVSLIITVCAVLLSVKLPKLLLNNNNFRFDLNFLIGYGAAIGFVLCAALSTVGMRKLKGTHFSIIILYTGFVGMIEATTVNASTFPFAIADCGWDHFLYTMLAICGFCALWMMTLAVQHEPAGLFAVQKASFEILVIIVFEITFFDIYPDWYVIAGACLVLISLAIIGMKNWIQMMPETSEKRKRFKWILS